METGGVWVVRGKSVLFCLFFLETYKTALKTKVYSFFLKNGFKILYTFLDSLSKVDGNMSGKSFRNTGIRNSIKGTIMNTINGTKRKTSAHVLKSWRDKRMSNIIHPGHAQAKQERPAEHSLLLRFSTAGKGKSLLQWSSEGTFMGYPRKADDNQYALVASLKGPHFDNTVLAKINFSFLRGRVLLCCPGRS